MRRTCRAVNARRNGSGWRKRPRPAVAIRNRARRLAGRDGERRGDRGRESGVPSDRCWPLRNTCRGGKVHGSARAAMGSFFPTCAQRKKCDGGSSRKFFGEEWRSFWSVPFFGVGDAWVEKRKAPES